MLIKPVKIDLLPDLYIPVVYFQRRLSLPGNCIYYDLLKLLMRPYQGLGGGERGQYYISRKQRPNFKQVNIGEQGK